MGVPKGDRKESSVEFENTYFKIYEDCVRLSTHSFGANDKLKEEYKLYIAIMTKEVFTTICEIGRFIRIANSIYPIYQSEYEQRRIAQDKAIGLCYDLLTKYQLMMKTLKVKDNKYVEEIKHILHEINCLKKWRTSDNKRYKQLG